MYKEESIRIQIVDKGRRMTLPYKKMIHEGFGLDDMIMNIRTPLADRKSSEYEHNPMWINWIFLRSIEVYHGLEDFRLG